MKNVREWINNTDKNSRKCWDFLILCLEKFVKCHDLLTCICDIYQHPTLTVWNTCAEWAFSIPACYMSLESLCVFWMVAFQRCLAIIRDFKAEFVYAWRASSCQSNPTSNVNSISDEYTCTACQINVIKQCKNVTFYNWNSRTNDSWSKTVYLGLSKHSEHVSVLIMTHRHS